MVPRLRAFNKCEIHTKNQMRSPRNQLKLSQQASRGSARRTIDQGDLSPQVPERTTNMLTVKAIDENVRLALNSSVGTPTRVHKNSLLRNKDQFYQTTVGVTLPKN